MWHRSQDEVDLAVLEPSGCLTCRQMSEMTITFLQYFTLLLNIFKTLRGLGWMGGQLNNVNLI